MNLRIPIFFRAGLVATLACLLAVAPLYAQSSADPPTLIKHLRAELSSKDAMRQESALIDVITLAACPSTCTVFLYSNQNKRLQINNDTDSGSIVDLEALSPDLLKLYRRAPTDGIRLMALSALVNIGNETAIDAVVRSSARYRQSQRVNSSTQKSLVAFYLGRYPELNERPLQRTNTFSLDDVRDVKVTRARTAKKAMKP